MWEAECQELVNTVLPPASTRHGLELPSSPARTQDAKLEVSGLLPHCVGCNAGVVAGAGQVGLEDPQDGSIGRNVVGVSASQRPTIFEPCNLGLRVA